MHVTNLPLKGFIMNPPKPSCIQTHTNSGEIKEFPYMCVCITYLYFSIQYPLCNFPSNSLFFSLFFLEKLKLVSVYYGWVKKQNFRFSGRETRIKLGPIFEKKQGIEYWRIPNWGFVHWRPWNLHYLPNPKVGIWYWTMSSTCYLPGLPLHLPCPHRPHCKTFFFFWRKKLA